MPDRVIRDELLHSERYWSVSIEAQRLFVHLLLNVDDTARFSGKNYTIRTACYPGHSIEPEKLERLLAELVDVDLVRMYHHINERYILIPRFKQRLRFRNSKYPDPPNEINDIPAEKTDSRPSHVSPKTAEVKRSEEKRSNTLSLTMFAEFWSAYPRKVAKGSAIKAWSKVNPDEALASEIVHAAKLFAASPACRDPKFTPHPATWLNARRWEDEPPQDLSHRPLSIV